MADEKIIKQRIPVWQALSELFFTPCMEFSDDEISIVEACKKSGYSLNLLENIYTYEVMPTLSKNISGLTNPWPGFDDDWLREKIVKYTNGKLVNENYQPSMLKKLHSKMIIYNNKAEWNTLKKKLREAGVK